MIVLTVEQNVKGVVITSSPGPMPRAASARWRPEVAEFTANAYGARTYSANSRSNLAVFGPVVSQPDFNVSITSSISSFPIAGRLNGINESMGYLCLCAQSAPARTNGGRLAVRAHTVVEFLMELMLESRPGMRAANKQLNERLHDTHFVYFTDTVRSAVATTTLFAS